MKYIYLLLTLLTLAIWITAFSIDDSLHVIACDVGQGDAILVTYKNIQILTDGGPDNSVLNCLGKYMPLYDRELELVILTHPQTDHYIGLIEVFRRYKVDNLLYNKRGSSNESYQVLEKEVGGGSTNTIRPQDGMVIRVGLIYLDVLDSSDEQGIVTLLRYGRSKALFMADVEKKKSDELSQNSKIQGVDYIKINHHGSKNGMTQNLLKVTMPKVAVISVGKNNRYGHPDKEIIEMLKNYNVKVLRTDEVGDIDINLSETQL